MEVPSYIIAFLLILTPVSTVCVSVMDSEVFNEYSVQIENYEKRISELENEVAYLKDRTEIELVKTEPAAREELPIAILPMLAALFTEPQQGLGLLDTLTKNMPEKNPALVELANSNDFSSVIAACMILVLSIATNSLRFVISHMDFVVDFTGRFISYIFTGFLSKLSDGTLFQIVTNALNMAIQMVTVFFVSLPVLFKNLPRILFTVYEYLPRVLSYLSIIIKNLPMFFIYSPIMIFSLVKPFLFTFAR